MLRLADRLPEDGKIDAVYIAGMGLTYNKQRLTVLNMACLEEAINWMHNGAKNLIFAGCYGGVVMERELSLRRGLATDQGVSEDAIHEIRGIVDTKDELSKCASKLNELDAKNVLLISDVYHMPRFCRWARLIMPDVEIFNKSVRPSAYEFVWEESLFKTLWTGIKPLWILWNVLLYYATPIFVRKS